MHDHIFNLWSKANVSWLTDLDRAELAFCDYADWLRHRDVVRSNDYTHACINIVRQRHGKGPL